MTSDFFSDNLKTSAKSLMKDILKSKGLNNDTEIKQYPKREEYV